MVGGGGGGWEVIDAKVDECRRARIEIINLPRFIS